MLTILPGSDWRAEIDSNLQSADIVLLLVSPDFIASDYCYDVEMATALRRHNLEQCIVIPIILRSVDFAPAPFASLQALPKNARPITLWADRDEAFLDVAKGIRALVGDHVSLHDQVSDQVKGYPDIGEGDLARIRTYRELFDRRAFYVPCIFENGMDSVKRACKQISYAMISGRVLDTGEPIRFEVIALYEVARRSDFESDFCRSTISQMGRYIAAIERAVDSLKVHLTSSGLPVRGDAFELEKNIGFIDATRALLETIDAGASVQYVRDAFLCMDKVDSAGTPYYNF